MMIWLFFISKELRFQDQFQDFRHCLNTMEFDSLDNFLILVLFHNLLKIALILHRENELFDPARNGMDDLMLETTNFSEIVSEVCLSRDAEIVSDLTVIKQRI